MNRGAVILGLILLVLVGYFIYAGMGIYGGFPFGNTGTMITVTYASSTVTGIYQQTTFTYSTGSSTFAVTGGAYSTGGSGYPGCAYYPEGSQCSPPVKIFTQQGPITSGEQYCAYYREYYGTSSCPVGSSDSGVQGASLLGGAASSIQLVSLAWFLNNSQLPFVDFRIVILLIAGIGIVMFGYRKR